MYKLPNERGILHIGLALFLVLGLIAFAWISFDITKFIRYKALDGEVASARTRESSIAAESTTTFGRVVEQGMQLLGLAPTAPRPGSDGNPVLQDGDVFVETYTGIKPYPDAPPCTDHKDTLYHGIWNEEKGCHYDHTHGYDPAKTIFKDVVAKWGQEISYPWQTPSENMMKHHGYVYLYDEAENGCEHTALPSGISGANCVTHILYLVHSMGTTFEISGRFHSFRVAARVCDPAQKNCGIVETGGWADYGVLHCPYKQTPCPLAVDPAPLAKDNGVLPDLVAIQQPPYRTTSRFDEIDRVLKSGHSVQFWNNQMLNPIVQPYYPEKYGNIFGSSWSFLDSWGTYNPENKTALNIICEKGDCEFNHSEAQLFTAGFSNLPPAPFSGFTDLKGNISSSCTAASSTCVPLIVGAGTPSGPSWLARKVRQADSEVAPILEYDVCFDKDGKLSNCHYSGDKTAGWIKPNMNMATMLNSDAHQF